MAAPNMDGLTPDELWQEWGKIYAHPRLTAREWFGPGVGSVKATKDLGNYACNKAVAMNCRERGDIEAALMYERICDRIYKRLPPWAKW